MIKSHMHYHYANIPPRARDNLNYLRQNKKKLFLPKLHFIFFYFENWAEPNSQPPHPSPPPLIL